MYNVLVISVFINKYPHFAYQQVFVRNNLNVFLHVFVYEKHAKSTMFCKSIVLFFKMKISVVKYYMCCCIRFL
jgi:hypothetical protein